MDNGTCIASIGYPFDLAMMEIEKHGFKGSIAGTYRLKHPGEVSEELI